ncbi:MAG: YitT family protein [Clostridia bacterium]
MFKRISNVLGILIGSFLTAVGVSVFMIPNKIAAGGLSGIATILYHLFSISPGIFLFAANIPLLLASGFLINWKFALNSVIGALATSGFVYLLENIAPLTSDPILATLFGGVISGIGIGIVFRSQGSTGGTDLLARILSKYTPITLGQALLSIDVFIIVSASIFFSPEYAMYALIGLFVTTKLIDAVQEGISYTKEIRIISDSVELITKRIISELDRGATLMYSKGAYSQQNRLVASVVIRRNELAMVKEIIRETDPNAFVIVSDVHQVLGEGFTRIDKMNE